MLTLKGYTDNIGVLYLDCPHQRLEGEELSSNLPNHQQVHILVGSLHAKVNSGFQVSEGVLCHKSLFSQSIFPKLVFPMYVPKQHCPLHVLCPSWRCTMHITNSEKVSSKELCLIWLKFLELWHLFPKYCQLPWETTVSYVHTLIFHQFFTTQILFPFLFISSCEKVFSFLVWTLLNILVWNFDF